MCAQVSLIRTVFCTTSEQYEMIHLQMLIHWAENTQSYISAKYLSSRFLGMQADLRKIVEASLQCQEKFASCNLCLLIPQSNNIPNPVGGEGLMSVCPFSSFFFWVTCSMITACRSLFFKEYEKKIKGSILLSHPLHAHRGQPVTGREFVFWVSVWESDTHKQMHGVYGRVEWSCSPSSWAEPLLVERCAGPRQISCLSGWRNGKTVMGVIAHPVQSNQNQQASSSTYIGTSKIFLTSLCLSHPNISTHPKKEAPLPVLTVTHEYLGAGESKEVATCQHYVMRCWLIFMFAAYAWFPDTAHTLLGVPRLPAPH